MRRRCALAAVAFLCGPFLAGAQAQTGTSAQADVATLLFEQSMWRDAPAGAALRYGFARRTGEKTSGGSLDDDIVVTLSPGDDAESRTAEVRMFSGRRARAAGPFFSSRTNPALVLVLEQNIQEIARLTGIEAGDLREAVRKAWRDDARIVAVPVDVAGRRVPGTRIVVSPFLADPARDRMKGLDTLTYTVEIADGTPGRITRIDIRTPAGRTPIFSETLRYLGSKGR